MKHKNMLIRVLSVLVVFGVFITACGAPATEAPAQTEAPEVTEAPAMTEEPAVTADAEQTEPQADEQT